MLARQLVSVLRSRDIDWQLIADPLGDNGLEFEFHFHLTDLAYSVRSLFE
jgi:hypothetical protein